MKAKHRTFTEFYVYKVVSETNPDEILYIGQTAVPETRLKHHYYNKKGILYMRKDIRLDVLEMVHSRYESRMAEHRWQKAVWPDRESDLEKNIKGCIRGGENQPTWGRAKGGSIGGKKGGVTSTHRMFHMSCGRDIKTQGAMSYHRKVCGCEVVHWYQMNSSSES